MTLRIGVALLAACLAAGAAFAAPAEEEMAAAAAPGPLGAYDPPIEASIVAQVLVDQQFADGDSFENNPWTRSWLDELGIQVNPVWIARTDDQYDQKIAVTIASGELPDIMLLEQDKLVSLARAGKLAPLGALYEEYILPELREHLDWSPITLEAGSVDGELYALPDYNRQPFAKYLWIRNDWQDAVGLPDPKTMDDVIELARAFATQDPDGNGKDDTFGLPLDKDFKFLGEGFFAGYGAYPANFIADMWLERDGRLEFAGVQPEVRTALGKLREMSEEGLLDPEFVVKDRGAAYGDVAAGKYGLLYGERWNPAWPLRQFRENHPDEDWHWVDLPSEDGSVARSPSNLKPPTFFAVRADYPNPEAMIKLYNHTYVHGSTREADLNVYADNIAINHVRLFHNIRMFAGHDLAVRLNAALEDGDTSRLSEGPEMRTFNQVKGYADGETAVVDNWIGYRVNGPGGPMITVGELYDSDHFVYNQFYGPLGTAYIQRGATLNSMKEEIFAKIIIGEEPLEAFDTFVEDWYRLGGQDVTDEVNEWWQTTK